jgi:hypothetical protein
MLLAMFKKSGQWPNRLAGRTIGHLLASWDACRGGWMATTAEAFLKMDNGGELIE